MDKNDDHNSGLVSRNILIDGRLRVAANANRGKVKDNEGEEAA